MRTIKEISGDYEVRCPFQSGEEEPERLVSNVAIG